MEKRPFIRIFLSAIFGMMAVFFVSCSKNDKEPDTATVSDIDGNVYNIITIGTQDWMKENLKTTKFNDGTPIPMVVDNAAWEALITPSYAWYENNAATYKNTYGALYNWYAASNSKLCPVGWHVPGNDEWSTLSDFLGGAAVAGGKMKETGTIHWSNINTGATNESKFTGLGHGYRSGDGTYGNIGVYGIYWSSTGGPADYNARARALANNSEQLMGGSTSATDKIAGLAVRCVKN
jgi:uncharacterized protein (TIGR02145 family)